VKLTATLPRRWRLSLRRLVLWARESGLRPLFRRLKRISRRLRGKHKPNYLLRRRIELGRNLAQLFAGTVQYGPFKGLRLSGESWWGADSASMLLGIYEQEVLESLRNVPKTHRTFIDIGAANGYYGIGVLVNGLFDHSCCFERSPVARRVIHVNAGLNDVSGRLRVLGAANKSFPALISPHNPSQCVLLVDMEGGEFDLLDEAVLATFRRAVIIVELHHWFFPDGDMKLKKLRDLAERYFRISELTTSARDLSRFRELAKFSDDDRWIICSEGRGRRMSWWRLDPLASSAG
jgi:hypothetical protein